ncbi:hypothetical protein NDU88_001793 [Pleurodeles waltl]|uniref:Uncharacterized protein n=1 Tax=Pleurodeles waltl TaxID=8319 RepID=A0AAV7P7Q1_PLEWA|nr:hypothetical protein NDU88_001793 [Pleurodeles waltl]
MPCVPLVFFKCVVFTTARSRFLCPGCRTRRTQQPWMQPLHAPDLVPWMSHQMCPTALDGARDAPNRPGCDSYYGLRMAQDSSTYQDPASAVDSQTKVIPGVPRFERREEEAGAIPADQEGGEGAVLFTHRQFL